MDLLQILRLLCLASMVVGCALAMHPSLSARVKSFQPYPGNGKLNSAFWARYMPAATSKAPQPRVDPSGVFLKQMASIGQSTRVIDTSPIAGIIGNEVIFLHSGAKD